MIDENYYDNARKNLDAMRQRVILSKKSEGKDLVEGLSEVKLPTAKNKSFPNKKTKEMDA